MGPRAADRGRLQRVQPEKRRGAERQVSRARRGVAMCHAHVHTMRKARRVAKPGSAKYRKFRAQLKGRADEGGGGEEAAGNIRVKTAENSAIRAS